MKYSFIIMLLLASTYAEGRSRFAVGAFGASPALAYSWQTKAEKIGLELGLAWSQGQTANMYPLTIDASLVLHESSKIEMDALIGAGANVVVPRDAIGGQTLVVPMADFGVVLQYKHNDWLGFSFSFKQYANWVDNEWIGRKEWVFFQGILGGVWFAI